MIWNQSQGSDDMGHTAEVPRLEEIVYSALDPNDCEWTISLHDDGATWNLVRTNSAGVFVQGAAGFKSAQAAMIYADRLADGMVPAMAPPLDKARRRVR